LHLRIGQKHSSTQFSHGEETVRSYMPKVGHRDTLIELLVLHR